MRNLFLFITVAFLFLLTECSQPCPPQSLEKIKYDYNSDLGRYGIAANALAFSSSGELIAKAHSLEILESSDGGPNHLLVEEEYYNQSKEIIYKGTLEFKFGIESASLVSEKSISGRKCFSAFTSWPCFSGY
jgi:hypothetical protein